MWLIYIGIVLAVLKLMHIDLFGPLSWWQVAIPFVLAFVWWEVFETLFGFDKRRAAKDQYEQARKDRIKNSWKAKKK
jgi:small Trp-rich protein